MLGKYRCSDSSMADSNFLCWWLPLWFSYVQIPLWPIVTLGKKYIENMVDSSDSSMADSNSPAM